MISPEQSTPDLLAPPQTYQVPMYPIAARIAMLARESGGGFVMPSARDCELNDVTTLADAAAWAWAMKVAMLPFTCDNAWLSDDWYSFAEWNDFAAARVRPAARPTSLARMLRSWVSSIL